MKQLSFCVSFFPAFIFQDSYPASPLGEVAYIVAPVSQAVSVFFYCYVQYNVEGPVFLCVGGYHYVLPFHTH